MAISQELLERSFRFFFDLLLPATVGYLLACYADRSHSSHSSRSSHSSHTEDKTRCERPKPPSTGTSRAKTQSTVEAPETPETPERPETTETPETPEALEVLEVPEVPNEAITSRDRLKTKLDRVIWGNIYFLAPLLTCLAFWKKEFVLSDLWLPVLGFLQQAMPMTLGWWRSKKFETPKDQGSYLIASAFANRSVVGLISVWIVFGQSGYATARWVMLAGPFVFYFFGFALARHFQNLDEGHSKDFSLKELLIGKHQLPLLGILLGIALNGFGVQRSSVFDQIFDPLVHLSAWMFMIPIGSSLDFGEMRRYVRPLLDLLAIRFIATPIICLVASILIGLRGESFAVLMMLSVTPASIGAVILSRLYKLNVHITAGAYVLTVTFYFFLVFPLILLLDAIYQ